MRSEREEGVGWPVTLNRDTQSPRRNRHDRHNRAQGTTSSPGDLIVPTRRPNSGDNHEEVEAVKGVGS